MTIKTVKIEITLQADITTEYTENDILEMFNHTTYEMFSECFSSENDSEPELKVDFIYAIIESNFIKTPN